LDLQGELGDWSLADRSAPWSGPSVNRAGGNSQSTQPAQDVSALTCSPEEWRQRPVDNNDA